MSARALVRIAAVGLAILLALIVGYAVATRTGPLISEDTRKSGDPARAIPAHEGRSLGPRGGPATSPAR